MIGLPVGPARRPVRPLSPEARTQLRAVLANVGVLVGRFWSRLSRGYKGITFLIGVVSVATFFGSMLPNNLLLNFLRQPIRVPLAFFLGPIQSFVWGPIGWVTVVLVRHCRPP